MKPVYQDITFDIELTNMTPEGYKRIIAITNALGDGGFSTYTYDESGQDDLDKEQQAQVDKLLTSR
jgi:hypothetical protein